MSFDDGVVDIAAREHIGQRVPHQFADAQLPLRATRRRITMLFLPCHCSKTFERHDRRAAAISSRRARIVPSFSGCPGQARA
jgi:hypothetical protein